MNERMDNIDIYNNSAQILNKKTPKKIVSWITILIILSNFFIIFSFVPFNVYKPCMGYVILSDNESFLVLNGGLSLSKKYKVYIKNKRYDYEIIDISADKIVLKVNLDDDIKIDKNIVKVNILKNRTTIFKIIINKIKKGFGL